MRYATRSDDGWSLETVPPPTFAGAGPDAPPTDPAATPDYGRYASLRLSFGSPVVAFYEVGGGDLYLARRDADAWQVLLLDGRDPETGRDTADVGRHATLAVDGHGDVSVAYYDASAGALRYLRSASGVLTGEVVDDGTSPPEGESWSDCERHLVGQGAALALDAAGRPRIAYADASSLTLRYATRSGSGRWARRTLDAQPGAGAWLDHASRGDHSFVAYAYVDLYRFRPIELRIREVAP